MWGLRWTKWHWDRFISELSVFLCQFHSTGAPLLVKLGKKTAHLHHRVVQKALRLWCVRSICYGALHHVKKKNVLQVTSPKVVSEHVISKLCWGKKSLGRRPCAVISKAMLGICFIIIHLQCHASLLFYSYFVFMHGVKVIHSVVLDCLSCKNYCNTGSFVDTVFFLLMNLLYLRY
jgi:hypothetical protein